MSKIDLLKEMFPLTIAVLATVAVMGVTVGFSTEVTATRIATAAGFFTLVWALARNWK